MDFQSFAQSAIMNNGAINGIVNFAADIALIYADFITICKYLGALIFVWGVWDLINFKKPNSQVKGKSIALKAIFGSMIFQISFWMTQTTQSLWVDASPAAPMTYVGMAQTANETNPFHAAIFAVLAILTFFGWVMTLVSFYGFATLGNSSDRHGAFWKNAWMFVGSLLLVNMMLFASDVAGSFLNVSGQVFSAGDFQ